MGSTLTQRMRVPSGIDHRVEELGYVGNGLVDQTAVPVALDIFPCTLQFPDEMRDGLSDRAALGPDLRELAVMHPLHVHGTTGTQRVFHDQATLIGQHWPYSPRSEQPR
jgi:hypothetical protein